MTAHCTSAEVILFCAIMLVLWIKNNYFPEWNDMLSLRPEL